MPTAAKSGQSGILDFGSTSSQITSDTMDIEDLLDDQGFDLLRPAPKPQVVVNRDTTTDNSWQSRKRGHSDRGYIDTSSPEKSRHRHKKHLKERKSRMDKEECLVATPTQCSMNAEALLDTFKSTEKQQLCCVKANNTNVSSRVPQADSATSAVIGVDWSDGDLSSIHRELQDSINKVREENVRERQKNKEKQKSWHAENRESASEGVMSCSLSEGNPGVCASSFNPNQLGRKQREFENQGSFLERSEDCACSAMQQEGSAAKTAEYVKKRKKKKKKEREKMDEKQRSRPGEAGQSFTEGELGNDQQSPPYEMQPSPDSYTASEGMREKRKKKTAKRSHDGQEAGGQNSEKISAAKKTTSKSDQQIHLLDEQKDKLKRNAGKSFKGSRTALSDWNWNDFRPLYLRFDLE